MTAIGRTPTLAQALALSLRERLEQMHTAIPGEVLSFDKTKCTANVAPLVRLPVQLEDGSYVQETLSVCVNVPVVMPGGGGFRIGFCPRKGDGVLLVFSEAHLERWQTKSGVQDAPLRRRFHLADGIAIVGLNSIPNAWKGITEGLLTMGHDTGPGIVFSDTTVELGARGDSRATEPVIKGQAYTDHESAALQSAISSIGAIGVKLAAAVAALSAAAGANAIPIVGGALAATPFATVGAQLGAIAGDLTSITAALTQFKTALPGDLSTIVKVK